MATNDIGRVTPIWRGFYSAAVTYELNDIVIDTAGSVWWHKSEELTTGVIPETGEIWDAVIDMSVFSELIQAAITTAQTALEAAQAAVAEVTADTERAETAADNAENSAAAASESAAGVGALAQAAERSAEAAAGSATGAAGSAQAAAGSKSDAEAYAVGKRGGEDVGTTDPTYHNNAKYYAEQAASEAEAAAQSAEDAQEVFDSIPEDYSQLSADVGGLKTQINEIWSEQIVGMTPTGRQKESVNLFKYAELVGEGKIIYSISNGKVVLTDSTTGYNTYLIPVDGESTYTFTNCRSAVLVSDRDYTAVSQIQSYTTSVDSTGGKYIIFSFNPTTYPINTYSVIKPVAEYIIPNNWNLGNFEVETPQINGMLPTGRTVESSNLFSMASLVASGKYVDRIVDGKAILLDSAGLNTYIIPVDGESVYTFTNCRTAVLVTDLEYTAVGNLLTYATEINSAGGNYILFSFNPTTYPVADYSITKPLEEYNIPNNWNIDKKSKSIYQRKTGSLTDGGSIALVGKTAIKYGQQIIFKGFISQFNEIELDFYNYNNSAISNKIVIGTEDIKIYTGNTLNGDPKQHGLTIINYISLVLDYTKDGVKLTLYSNGNNFTLTTSFEDLTSGIVSPTIKSTGTICTTAVFEINFPITKRKIWYFGDSYIGFKNPARWPYYMLADNFDYILLCGYAGGTSYTTQTALQALLNYGKPDIAVFATGMNDGSDADENTPSTQWVNARNIFINVCEENNITPVFGTIPNVPTINNKGKNKWIRNSGYRYIDYANAVGSEDNNYWYDGMLEENADLSKRVHSTVSGAKALYTQLLADLPEILDPN